MTPEVVEAVCGTCRAAMFVGMALGLIGGGAAGVLAMALLIANRTDL